MAQTLRLVVRTSIGGDHARIRLSNEYGDRPLVIGISRKSFLKKLVDSTEMRNRVVPTVAMTSILRARGADVFRVHDVKENVAALRITEEMLR